MRRRIVFPREVLLVEIERRCPDVMCQARARIGLTKEEARAYTGFECERCERWHEDALSERDIPDWWEELKVTGLEGVRPARETGAPDETAATVARLSAEWRRAQARERAPEGEEGGPEA